MARERSAVVSVKGDEAVKLRHRIWHRRHSGVSMHEPFVLRNHSGVSGGFESTTETVQGRAIRLSSGFTSACVQLLRIDAALDL